MINLEKEFDLKRHDSSNDQSLRAYSAADEYLLQDFNKLETKPSHVTIYNDRFGFLTCHLGLFEPTIILTNKSQEKAIHLNIKANSLSIPQFSNPISVLKNKIEFALIKLPKSLDLFKLFLEQIAKNSTPDVIVVVSFMTRHFSPQILEIAQNYFEVVEQSRAVKKARLVTLSKKKDVNRLNTFYPINYKDQTYKQYLGVFSASHIDYATQFFLEHLKLNKSDNVILDLASGNGIIGKEILCKLPNAEIHLMDDSYLAVQSAKLNIRGENIHHHYNNDLSKFEDEKFDLIVTNPPFHFEYETNINIPVQLFKECFRCLRVGGNLQVVANQHLNYKTHLKSIFPTIDILSQNEKFIVYRCVK